MLSNKSDWGALHRWYNSPTGRDCSSAEKDVLNSTLQVLYGYAIITLGIPATVDYLQASPIAHRIRLDLITPSPNTKFDLLADPGCLPIASDCIDVALLPHTIEFQQAPLAVLHEIDRILIPEGHVVIMGFNPLSLWCLLRSLNICWNKLRAHSMLDWQAHLISVSRLRLWLIELGFDILSVQYYTFPGAMGHHWLLRGSGYLLLARKRVSTLTPIRPRWHTKRTRLIATGLAERSMKDKHG
jgi:SAM-dependent methyltransferase